MTSLVIAIFATVGVLVSLALILPCEGCRLRRKRMQAAYDEWRRSHLERERSKKPSGE